MATFAEIADVEAINTHRTYDDNSRPTASEVQGFLDSANSELTAALLAKDWTQVTSAAFADTYPDAFSALRKIAALEAAAYAEAATTALEVTTEVSGHVRMLFRQKEKALELILENGLPGVGDDDVPADPGGSYAAGGAVAADDPLFTIEETFG